jgi:tetraacyldisaccharide 4'-kinase
LYIVLTSYNDLFVDDFLLPTGNLRESRNGAKRADAIIVTKCLTNLTQKNKSEITKKIHLYTKSIITPIFFSSIGYSDKLHNRIDEVGLNSLSNQNIFVVAGIAKPIPFVNKIKEISDNVTVSLFKDHHNFTAKEIQSIETELQNKIGITTEKDFVRLQDKITTKNWYYLPIKSEFLENKSEFNFLITRFITSFSEKNSL